MTIKIELKIKIHVIFPFLRKFISDDEYIYNSSNVFRTLNLPNVSFEYLKCVYIYSNYVHP